MVQIKNTAYFLDKYIATMGIEIVHKFTNFSLQEFNLMWLDFKPYIETRWDVGSLPARSVLVICCSWRSQFSRMEAHGTIYTPKLAGSWESEQAQKKKKKPPTFRGRVAGSLRGPSILPGKRGTRGHGASQRQRRCTTASASAYRGGASNKASACGGKAGARVEWKNSGWSARPPRSSGQGPDVRQNALHYPACRQSSPADGRMGFPLPMEPEQAFDGRRMGFPLSMEPEQAFDGRDPSVRP
ncbi:TPA: hypothetical protein N0F65_010823 [Lagenidium giganteum]|uniref:Uncharacterized protein n=1 Tax=Lagenidium giganteum TaxID=4803 RepID=A0AAV2Z4L1_9STRA|nr:TPA: hypothetical protein N0F65_010823 [Lagenidium giganteum]